MSGEQSTNKGNLFKLCEEVSCECGVAFKLENASVLTTFKGGGDAYTFTPASEEEFIEVYLSFALRGVEPFILGGGSDVIIADGICSVPFISTRRLNAIKICGDEVMAGCGARISDVIAELRRHGLGGLEFMTGVPATAGGAAHMNAGAFDAQTADYISEIRILNADCVKNNIKSQINDCGSDAVIKCVENSEDSGVISVIKRESLQLGYRQGVYGTILSVVFKADKIGEEESIRRASEYMRLRKSKQPRQPSCGSVFRNGEQPSGKLIELCGLRGVRVGGAMISDLHGNFIVNTGGGTASDFMALVMLCERSVMEKFGVKLAREFVYVS